MSGRHRKGLVAGAGGVEPAGAAQADTWPRALVRRMALLLLLKLVALAGLWWWFFSPSQRPPAHAAAVAERFLAVPPAHNLESDRRE